MPCVVWAEESKAGLCFEIRQQQQKCWCKPNVQSLANLQAPRKIPCHALYDRENFNKHFQRRDKCISQNSVKMAQHS